MEQPPGFVAQTEYRGGVCKLKKVVTKSMLWKILQSSNGIWPPLLPDRLLGFSLHT
jgi:hypothetical protein